MPSDEKKIARLKNVKRPRYGKRKPKCSPRQPKLKTRMYARTNLKSGPMHERRSFRGAIT